MAKPWKTIECVATPEGSLELRQRGARDFLITLGGGVLMNSRTHHSELALGQLACDHLKGAARPKVLVGGLGMGYTLKAVLDTLPVSGRVVVAELNPVVLKWCQGPLAVLTHHAAADPRAKVEIDDVAHLIKRYAGQPHLKKLDAIIMDLYSGPYARSHKRRDPLFGSIAIERAHRALKSNGVFAVWGENYDAGFAKRMPEAGFKLTTHRSGRGGFRHVIYLGKKATGHK